MASDEVFTLDSTIIKLVTDTGLEGYGETCPIGPVYQPMHAPGARAALSEMAPRLLGKNPLLIDKFYRAMHTALNGHNYAKAALDIACWDIAGKHYGARVCDLLGGALRENVESYYATGVNTAERTAKIVQEKIAEGYKRIQVKVGGRNVEEDIETIKRVGEVSYQLERKLTATCVPGSHHGWTTHAKSQ